MIIEIPIIPNDSFEIDDAFYLFRIVVLNL